MRKKKIPMFKKKLHNKNFDIPKKKIRYKRQWNEGSDGKKGQSK